MLAELVAGILNRSFSVIDAAALFPGDTVHLIKGWADTCDFDERPIVGAEPFLVVDRNVFSGTIGLIPGIDETDRLTPDQRIVHASLRDDLQNLGRRERIEHHDASLVLKD